MIERDKRWNEGRQVWVAPPVVFRPQGYGVELIHRDVARDFICAQHYSRSYPADRLNVGMKNAAGELVAVAVFSIPMQQQVIPCWLGLAPDNGTELGRFVCDPSVAYNGESWFLARAFRILREEKPVHAVLSYADPIERSAIGGEVVKPSHWGTIYQAANAMLAGKSDSRTLVLAPDGSVVNGRALTKIRKRERGWRYAVEQLVAQGVPEPDTDDLKQWLARVLADFRRIRHTGNLAYVFGLTKHGTRTLRELHTKPLTYPKRAAA